MLLLRRAFLSSRLGALHLEWAGPSPELSEQKGHKMSAPVQARLGTDLEQENDGDTSTPEQMVAAETQGGRGVGNKSEAGVSQWENLGVKELVRLKALTGALLQGGSSGLGLMGDGWAKTRFGGNDSEPPEDQKEKLIPG